MKMETGRSAERGAGGDLWAGGKWNEWWWDENSRDPGGPAQGQGLDRQVALGSMKLEESFWQAQIAFSSFQGSLILSYIEILSSLGFK